MNQEPRMNQESVHVGADCVELRNRILSGIMQHEDSAEPCGISDDGR
jgi:hypothetical protein